MQRELEPGGGQLKARQTEVRDALLRAGGGDFEKAGRAVLAALRGPELESFLKPFAAGLAKAVPFTEALAKELSEAGRLSTSDSRWAGRPVVKVGQDINYRKLEKR